MVERVTEPLLGEEVLFQPPESNSQPKPAVKPDHTAGRPRSRAQRAASLLNRRAEQDPRPPKEPKETPPYRKGALVEPIANLYGLGAMVLAPFDPNCAQTLMVNAQNCAVAWDELAKENESVRRILHALVETSAWGKVAIAHVPLLVGVAVHHSKGAENFVRGMQERQQAADSEPEYAEPQFTEGDSLRFSGPVPPDVWGTPEPTKMNGHKDVR